MPKRTFKVSGNAADAELSGNFYDGETPPPGTYDVILKKMRLKENKNGDDMLNLLYEINEPKSSEKFEYNGYGFWENRNVTDSGAPFVNQFLDAFGFDKKAFWAGVVLDEEDPPNVTKIGAKRFTGEHAARVGTKNDPYNGEDRLAITRFLKPKEADEDEGDAEETEGMALGEEGEAGEEGEDTAPYTEAELADLELSDLKEIAEGYEIELKKGVRSTTIIAAILEAQEAALEEAAEEEGEEEAEEEAAEGDEDAVSEEDLEEMELPDLKEYAESIELEFPPKITKSKLIALIVEFTGAPEETAEEDAEAGDFYSPEDLDGMELSDLKELAVDTYDITLPKPPIKRKVIALILEAQEAAGAPPF